MADHAPPEEADGPRIRPFADFLVANDKGRTHAQLSEALHDLVAAVRDTGKAGTVTLQIKVAPLGKDVDQLKVTANVGLKRPAEEPRPSIFFADADGNLSRTDPNQPQIEGLRVAELPAAKTRGTR